MPAYTEYDTMDRLSKIESELTRLRADLAHSGTLLQEATIACQLSEQEAITLRAERNAFQNQCIGLKHKMVLMRDERDALAAQCEKFRDALEEYVHVCSSVNDPNVFSPKVADEGHYARTALALPDLAADILAKRDAETLRRAADHFVAGGVSEELRRMADDIEKGTNPV